MRRPTLFQGGPVLVALIRSKVSVLVRSRVAASRAVRYSTGADAGCAGVAAGAVSAFASSASSVARRADSRANSVRISAARLWFMPCKYVSALRFLSRANL